MMNNVSACLTFPYSRDINTKSVLSPISSQSHAHNVQTGGGGDIATNNPKK